MKHVRSLLCYRVDFDDQVSEIRQVPIDYSVELTFSLLACSQLDHTMGLPDPPITTAELIRRLWARRPNPYWLSTTST